MNKKSTRREFLQKTGLSAALLTMGSFSNLFASAVSRPNILLFTADDMNYDAVGVYGCKIKNITPNIDTLAAGGIQFNQAHVTIAVCQPSRGALMTGRYPHTSGIEGFNHINGSTVALLTEELQKAGYLNGILGKTKHSSPKDEFKWDMIHDVAEIGQGRDPEKYYHYTKSFFAKAKNENKPFFLMANSHDPHRPFAGSESEWRRWKTNVPKISRKIEADEVDVPGFLPDIPDVRKEVAQYYTSVHRCDQTVGAVIKALKETGLEKDTLVMFLSDNGMAFPFAKTNCYLASTKTPWIVNWPGKIKPGQVDREHFISGIDFMPTVLQVIGLELVEAMDGTSFLPLLMGERQANREFVFTQFHETSGKNRYPMRCVQNKRFGYIFNFWADGETVFKNESQNGLTFKAMQEAAETDSTISERVKLFQYRVPEEFYDFEYDPAARTNLIDNPIYFDEIQKFRQQLLNWMQQTNDPALTAFEDRNNPDKIKKFMEDQIGDNRPKPGVKVHHKSVGGLITHEIPYSPSYTGGGTMALIDGIRAPKKLGDISNYKLWQGFEGTDLDVTVDLRKNTSVNKVSTGFLHHHRDWIFLPEFVEYSVSTDDKQFKTIKTVKNSVPLKQSGMIREVFSCILDGIEIRYIRVFAKSIGLCPNWHSGAGEKAWLFADEIIVE